MIEQQTLITYLVILLGFVLIPGPAVLLALTRAATSGSKVGIATALGIAAGDLLHTLMAVVGISALIMTSAIMFTIVKVLGGAYLVYLGVKALLERASVNLAVSGSGVRLSPASAFQQAVLAEVLNPKSAMFFLAFLPQFVNPDHGAVAVQLLILGVLFVLVGATTTVIVALVSGKLGNLLKKNQTVIRWQGKVVGTIYCALGLRIALQER